MPKISVLLPVYNGERYLNEALESILNQTYRDFELIVINDCSTDSTEEIINGYDDPRIVVLKNEVNSGISATLNRGIKVAKGEYLARMDADDVAFEERFHKQLEFMEGHPDVGVLGTGIFQFGEGMEKSPFYFSSDPEQIKAEALFSCPIAHPTVLIRKSTLEDAGLQYSEEFNGLEDYYLWWQVLRTSKIATLKEPLLNYRMHPGQVTKQRPQSYYDKVDRFMKERLDTIKLNAGESERTVIAKYCAGAADRFTPEELERFETLALRLLEQNRSVRYFEPRALRTVLGQSVLKICRKSLEEEDRKQAVRQAVKRGVVPRLLGLRSLLGQ